MLVIGELLAMTPLFHPSHLFFHLFFFSLLTSFPPFSPLFMVSPLFFPSFSFLTVCIGKKCSSFFTQWNTGGVEKGSRWSERNVRRLRNDYLQFPLGVPSMRIRSLHRLPSKKGRGTRWQAGKYQGMWNKNAILSFWFLLNE